MIDHCEWHLPPRTLSGGIVDHVAASFRRRVANVGSCSPAIQWNDFATESEAASDGTVPLSCFDCAVAVATDRATFKVPITCLGCHSQRRTPPFAVPNQQCAASLNYDCVSRNHGEQTSQLDRKTIARSARESKSPTSPQNGQ
jgi:hypothetical protein